MYKESPRELQEKLNSPTQYFRKSLIEEKVAMLQAETTLPYSYWAEEKKLLINILQSQLSDQSRLLLLRADEVNTNVEMFIQSDVPFQCDELEIFKTKWVYKMSHLLHELCSINETKILLNAVENCFYTGGGNE
jgi:hypothetical protein